MPGPPPAAPTEPSEKLSCPEDDYGLVTVSKMYAMLVEHEARLKSHVDQSIERLTQRMNLTESDYPNIMHVPSQNATPRRGGKSTHTSQYKTGVPTYVRKLVEGTLKGSGGLGNSTLRSGTGIANSWSSVEHNLVRRKQLWVWYDICTMIVIFLYACLMGVNLQVTTLRGSEPPWTNQGELAFCIFFSVDLGIRVLVEQLRFVTGPMKWWNLLDVVLVSLMISSQITQYGLISSMSGLRVLRLLRVLRIMRLAKYFAKWPQFRQIRILVASIGESLKMMIWLMLLAFSVIYVFSLVLTEGVWQSCREDSQREELLCKKFGTLTGSMLTLYQILYSGVLWGELWDEMTAWHWFFQFFYLLYVSFSVVILGNMMASFLFSLQKKVSKKEKENLIQSEIESKEEFVQQMNVVFREFDQNGNGAISWTEFQIALEDQRMHAFLSSLDLDISDAIGLFSVLDSDGTGAIEHSEFLLGCLRLRGGAKAVDMVRVQMEQEWMHQAMLTMRSMMQDLMKVSRAKAFEMQLELTPSCDGSDIELSDFAKFSSSSQIFPKSSESMGVTGLLSYEYRTNLPSEERAVSLKELKRISSDALLASRHGWDDPRTGRRIESNTLNLYHFSYYHILPKTAPKTGLLLRMEPLKSQLLHWRALCGQQIFQQSDKMTLPSASATILRADMDGDVLTVCVALSQGRFTTHAEDGNIMLGDAPLGKLQSMECLNSFSYKEYLSLTPCKPTWYCSHWWGEPIVSFVNCCQKHAVLRRLNDTMANYWVCGYANRQHELELEIGQDITQSSFYRALHVAEGLLLILDQDATPFSRIWCDYEVYSSITDPDKMLDIVTMVQSKKQSPGAQMLSKSPLPGESAVAKSVREQNFPLSLLLHGLQVCLEDGEATVQKDKDGILFEMASHADLSTTAGQELLQQNLKRANDALHSTFAILAWPQAMKHGRLLDFANHKEQKLSSKARQKVKLPEILAMDDDREVLELSLAHFEETCVDSSVKILAAGLPPNLQDLRLSFEGCNRITDQSLSALGSRFCLGLKRLYLDFIGCSKLTDTGLYAIAGGLPPALEDLELHFAGCPLLTAAGVGFLREQLPSGLQTFTASFKGTGINRNFATLEEFQG